MPSPPDGWPTGEDILAVDDLSEALRAALEQLTAEDVLGVLQLMNPQTRRYVLREIGLQSASRINRGMAAHIVARLRAAPLDAPAPLLTDLVSPLLSLLESPMTGQQWTAVTSGQQRAAFAAFADHRRAARLLTFVVPVMPAPLVQAGLVLAVRSGAPAAALALACLSPLDDAAGKAFTVLASEYPRMPSAPHVPLPECGVAQRLRDLDVLQGVELDSDGLTSLLERIADDVHGEDGLLAALDRLEDADDEQGADDLGPSSCPDQVDEPGDHDVGAVAAASADLIDQVEELLELWADATAAATAISSALSAGQLPDSSDVTDLLLLVDAADTLRTLADGHGDGTVPLGLETREQLAALVAGARRRAQLLSRAWLLALTGLTGPDSVADPVSRVRQLAQAALSQGTPDEQLPGLTALSTVILAGLARRGGDPVDYTTVSAAEAAVREHLPELGALLLPAAFGDLVLPPPGDEPTVAGQVCPPADDQEDPGQVASAADEPVRDDAGGVAMTATTAEEASSTAQVVSRADEARAVSGTGDADADRSVRGVVGEVRDASPTGAEAAAPDATTATPMGDAAPVRAPACDGAAGDVAGAGHVPGAHDADPVPVEPDRAEPSPPVDDLSDLDALLAGGLGTELSAMTGARRRSTPRPAAVRRADAPPDARGTGGSNCRDGLRDDQQARCAPTDVADLEQAQVQLLASHRFGLAADVLEAGGASDATCAARRLAALATALRHSTGPVAAAFAAQSTHISRDALADDRPGQLLAWAAAARIAVLAPSANPAGVLLELAPSLADHPALTEVGQALIEASRTGIVVLPEAAGQVGSLAAAEQEAAAHAARAVDLLQDAVTRAIKYPPANGVHKNWMAPSGPLGELLVLVAGNSADDVPAVRDRVVALRGRGERAVDDTFAELRRARNRNSKNKIVSGARSTLLSRWDETLDLAGSWADAAERASERADRLSSGSWQAAPLANLRRRLTTVRDAALHELAGDLLHGEHTPTDAAALAAADLLTAAFTTCDGDPPTGQESRVAFAEHGELLATDLSLDPDTLLPPAGLSTADLPVLLELAQDGPPSWTAVYERRAQAGDHDLTAALAAGLRGIDAALAQALDRRRTADVPAAADAASQEVAALLSLIDARRMTGALDDGPWSALSARALALDEPSRRDFGRIRAEAAALRVELDGYQKAKIEKTLTRIRQREADHPAVAGVADTLRELASTGHIASAEEYLEQAVSGGELPARDAEPHHLARFFPAVPDLAAHAPLLSELRTALSGGQASPAVRALALAAGADLDSMSATRREAGVRALGSWAALHAARPGGAPRQLDAVSALRNVLAQAGLEFSDVTFGAAAGQTGRQWATLRRVRGTGKALTPALGSAMSPDGATLRVLLVTGAPTPATVIEWMSTEPADHTVLALWLGPALSAQDRRAVCDAARGRSRPPVLLLDQAALAYLVCQAEPRRSTFAAIALPFTAASPYRDTPGDAAPEMFYGRTDEIASVLDLSGPSFVSGGRQLGKSSVLKAAARRFEASSAERVAVLISVFTVGGDGDAGRLWESLWPKLAARGIVAEQLPGGDLAAAAYAGVMAWLEQDPARALLILLDEADAFLDADAAGNAFAHVDWCRRLMLDSGRRAKVVFAGLHRTARFEALPNQPLSHLGRPVSIGPLRPQHAYDLLTRPLAALGFRFADDVAIPARVLALANNMPALLQLFGAALVAHLTAQPVPADGPPQTITDEDVDAVFFDPELRAALREKYVLTLNLDHRYLVLAYCVAQAAHEHGIDASLSLPELSDAARAAWPAGFAGSGADDLRGLVAECVDLGVLAADAGRFRVRTPTVLRLLGTEEDVLETLDSAPDRLSVPSAADSGSYRRRVKGSRSPFTERQLGQLFTPSSRVLVITGTVATGADHAFAALEAAREEGASRLDALSRCHTVTPDGVRRDVERTATAHALLLADGRTLSSEALVEVLDAAAEAVAGTPRQVTVAVLTSPANAVAWQQWADRLELARVDAAGLRLWCDEDNLPFRDERARGELMAATGGWPWLLGRLAVGTASQSPVTSGARWLGELRGFLAGSGATELARSSGLPAGSALATALRSAAALTASTGEDPHSLAELLEMDDTVDLLGAARADGFRDLTAVVDVLTSLGLFAADASGLLRAEPVLTAVLDQAHGATATAGQA